MNTPECLNCGSNEVTGLQTLESRCAWQAEMLERAKEAFTDVALRIVKKEPQDLFGHAKFLADLEKGPKK